ncbi:hypothetical protein BUY35_00320 [Staphylococcus cohnii]|nr:hypothetical protein BUY35_00320 [Staphylococcus cohnii]
MITLQSLFNEAETHIQESMNELPVRGNYKVFLKEIFNLNEQIFEMLYEHDEDNKGKYNYTEDDILETINILAQYQKN